VLSESCSIAHQSYLLKNFVETYEDVV
jgi:hypothetical protein